MPFRSQLPCSVLLLLAATLAGCPSGDDDDSTPVADPWEVDDDGDGLSELDGDCDDTDPAVAPGAEEVCDGVDNDCSGSIDDDATDASTWYADADGDGYGAIEYSVLACSAPTGYVAVPGDCHDLDAAYNPDAIEADCDDPNDYNCDGSVGSEDLDGDGYAACDDCDDGDLGVHPDAPELCDGVDNDCDGTPDGPNSIDATQWYVDGDSDTWGDPATGAPACSAPAGTVVNGTDCDDANPAINPAATEVCNHLDDDCDADVDEADASDATIWYADTDGDGYGDSAAGAASCDQPAGSVADSTDCDDTQALSAPNLTEICDAIDNDCDTDVDEADAVGAPTWFADQDGDTYGDADSTQVACDQPANFVADATDCDDTSALATPVGVEVCDTLDNDCDGTIDGADATDATAWFADVDGDTFGNAAASLLACSQPTGMVVDATDCDDTAISINTAGTELCNNADDDCDGTVDEADASDASTWYSDGDGDGFGDGAAPVVACDQPAGTVTDATDCNDASALAYPGLAELCDALDNDCDTVVDEPDAIDAVTWYADSDGDTFGDPSAPIIGCSQPVNSASSSTDCDDSSALAFPGGSEVCDGLDNDCDGAVDEADAADASTWYADSDGDGDGDPGAPQQSCGQPAGYVASNTDCDDGDALSRLGLPEICDGADNDCDTAIDEDSALDATTWYADTDGDTYGDAGSPDTECSQPAGTVADATDCDDTLTAVNPGATEECNTIDDDCDGAIDESGTNAGSWYPDGDGDGQGAGAAVIACSQPAGLVATNDDCDDGDATRFNGAPELCDGRYNECSGAGGWSVSNEAGAVSFEDVAGAWSSVSTAWGGGSAASAVAVTVAGDGLLWVCEGTYYVNVTVTGAADLVARPGVGAVTLDGADTGAVVTIDGAVASLDALTLTNGSAPTGGGLAILNGASVALVDVSITGSESTGDGGGMAVTGGSDVTASNLTLSGNAAGVSGGGVVVEGAGSLEITGGLVSLNTSSSVGAGLRVDNNATATLNQTWVTDNVANANGGGVSMAGAVTLVDSVVSGNATGTRGGGFSIGSALLTLTSSIVSDNDGNQWGGGIYCSSCTADLTDSSISGNAASTGGGIGGLGVIAMSGGALVNNVADGSLSGFPGRGGGAFVQDSGSTITLTGVAIRGNVAADDGGGLYVISATGTLSSCSVEANYAADRGGGLLAVTGATLVVGGGTLSGNTSGGNGGGVTVQGGSSSITMDGTAVTDNSSGGDGGGLWSNSGGVTVTNAVIDGNLSAGDGGGIFGGSGASVSVADTDVSNNVTVGDGGGLFLTVGSASNSSFSGNMPDDTYNPDAADSDTWGSNVSFTCSAAGCN